MNTAVTLPETLRRISRIILLVCALALPLVPLRGGEAGEPMYAENDQHRILGIMPNYKTTSLAASDLRNLSVKQKFALATKDAFDSSAFLSTVFYAGMAHATHQYPSFGEGAQGISRRYALMFTDGVQGTYFTEAIMPAIFRQDPRYFRKGSGPAITRVSHAFTSLLLVKSDMGGMQLNASELLGNAASSSLSNLYYPTAERSLHNTTMRVSTSLLSDAMNNLVREFWPDIVGLVKHHRKDR